LGKSMLELEKKAVAMRTALFWAITQHVVVFLPTFRDNLSVPHLQGITTTRYVTAQKKAVLHLLGGGGLKSRRVTTVWTRKEEVTK
jgi:hypothetical protein